MSLITERTVFEDGYRDKVFTIWYAMGKPIAKYLLQQIPLSEAGKKPSIEAVISWIKSEEFQSRASLLDEQVMSQINQKMIAEKVEMLNRHADVGIQMQNMAMTYLQEHKEDLGISASVRLLVAGVEVERESRGIATTVEKIGRMSDTELEKEIQTLIERAPVEFLPGRGDDIDASFTDSIE
jgi:DNA polymerase I-like protein with 3'-5' exonuclease and polymerase domains